MTTARKRIGAQAPTTKLAQSLESWLSRATDTERAVFRSGYGSGYKAGQAAAEIRAMGYHVGMTVESLCPLQTDAPARKSYEAVQAAQREDDLAITMLLHKPNHKATIAAQDARISLRNARRLYFQAVVGMDDDQRGRLNAAQFGFRYGLSRGLHDGPAHVDIDALTIHYAGLDINLDGKTFEFLAALVEHVGTPVEHSILMSRLDCDQYHLKFKRRDLRDALKRRGLQQINSAITVTEDGYMLAVHPLAARP